LWVDLSRQPAVAAAFRVVTAPSTVLLAADGRVRSFNHGFAPAEQLSAQLSALGAWPVSPRSRLPAAPPARGVPPSGGQRSGAPTPTRVGPPPAARHRQRVGGMSVRHPGRPLRPLP